MLHEDDPCCFAGRDRHDQIKAYDAAVQGAVEDRAAGMAARQARLHARQLTRPRARQGRRSGGSRGGGGSDGGGITGAVPGTGAGASANTGVGGGNSSGSGWFSTAVVDWDAHEYSPRDKAVIAEAWALWAEGAPHEAYAGLPCGILNAPDVPCPC